MCAGRGGVDACVVNADPKETSAEAEPLLDSSTGFKIYFAGNGAGRSFEKLRSAQDFFFDISTSR